MTYTFADIDEFNDFIMYLMRSGGSACFRGIDIIRIAYHITES